MRHYFKAVPSGAAFFVLGTLSGKGGFQLKRHNVL